MQTPYVSNIDAIEFSKKVMYTSSTWCSVCVYMHIYQPIISEKVGNEKLSKTIYNYSEKKAVVVSNSMAKVNKITLSACLSTHLFGQKMKTDKNIDGISLLVDLSDIHLGSFQNITNIYIRIYIYMHKETSFF